MKKFSLTNHSNLKGKTRKEIIDFLGDDYHPESNECTLVYIIKKTWFSKGRALFIEFDKTEIADTFFTLNNYDFKK
ncbi:hypothetical protein [Chryseobacterium koreense]|uniref:hypothetical protein n=1 Tax=Chryseobacterium koreense TaxID=232216 RepID=UPI0026EC0214|nr:hypothetical protein [Chryseobacterium koreense]